MVGLCPSSLVKGMRIRSLRETRKRNRRSLHYATPDFLLNLVALANIMRLSLRKGAHAVLSSAAWQEIRGSVVERPAVSFSGLTQTV
jgi:hypothetical protein